LSSLRTCPGMINKILGLLKLSEYIEKTLEERTEHLDLSEPHLLHPVEGRVLKVKPLREQMFQTFGITDCDVGLSKIHICHRCDEPNCRSIYHTYLGTATENFSDRIQEKSYRGEGSWYNNGFYSVKWEEGMPPLPKDFIKGRQQSHSDKSSETRLKHRIRNATNGKVNIQVKQGLGETLPEGFRWGWTIPPHKLKTCPHCGTTGGGGNMKRYHFDNCKLRDS
jgi:hypothetical protein